MIPGVAGVVASSGPAPFSPSFVAVSTSQLVAIPVGATFVDVYAVDGGMDGSDGTTGVGGSGGDGGQCNYDTNISVAGHSNIYCSIGTNRVFGGTRGVGATTPIWDSAQGIAITLGSNMAGGTGGIPTGIGTGIGGGGGGAAGDTSAGSNGHTGLSGNNFGGAHGTGVVSGHVGDGGMGGESGTQPVPGFPWGGGGGGGDGTGTTSGASGAWGGILLHFT